MRRLRICIAGVDGTVGSALWHELSRFYRVFGLDVQARWHPPGSNVHRVDITCREEATRVLRAIRPQTIIHAAGAATIQAADADPAHAHGEVDGIVNLIKISAELGIRNVIHLTSYLVYGPTTVPADESFPLATPTSVYQRCKIEVETASRELATKDMNLLLLRVCQLVSPADRHESRFVPSVCRAIAEGLLPELHADSEDIVREWLAILDFATIVKQLIAWQAMRNGGAEIVNVSVGERLTTLQFLQRILRLAGLPEDHFARTGSNQDTAELPRHYWLNTKKLRSIIGDLPKSSLDKTIRAALNRAGCFDGRCKAISVAHAVRMG